MHEIPPRYGKPNDVLLLMAGNEQEQTDYLRGLLASSITMFVFFLVWSVLLLIFKVFAPRDSTNHTRWLSGELLQVDEPPSQKHQPYQYAEWLKYYQSVKRQLYCFRAVVLFAGMSIVVSAIVMSVGGTNALTQTLDAARLSIGLVHGLATQAISIIDQVILLNQKVSSEIFTLLEDVNGMCPLIRDPLCDNLQDLSTCDISGFLGDDLNDVFQMVLGHFAAGDRSVIYQEIIKAKSGLQDVQTMAVDAEDAASHFNWALILSMVLSLLLALLCLFIMSSLVFQMPKMMTCLKSRILMPIFAVLVVTSYIFSLLFVTASMATADLCVYKSSESNVDIRILTLLGRFRNTLSPIVLEFARFYIRQCPPQLLPQELVSQMDYVVAGVPAIKQFSAIVEESTDLIQGACGFQEGETQKLLNLADAAQVNLCEVADILKRVRLFFQCENWFPLYETTTYEALCYDSTDGFAYIASTQFVIVFMAFVILTFRVAFWDVQIGDGDEHEDHVTENGLKKSDTENTEKEDERYYSGISSKLMPSSTKQGSVIIQSDKASDGRGHIDKNPRGSAIDTTFSTLNTTTFSNDLELHEAPTSFSDGSTQENTENSDVSGELVLEHPRRRPPPRVRRSVDPPAANEAENEDEIEEMGIEVEHFDNRADAWAVWARQFAGVPPPDDSDEDEERSVGGQF